MSKYKSLNLKVTFKHIEKKDAKIVSNKHKKKAENLSISIGRFQGFVQGGFHTLSSK